MLVGAVMGFWAVQRIGGPGGDRAVPRGARRRARRARGRAAPRVPRDHAAREPDRLGPRADDLRRRGRALVVPRQRPRPRRRAGRSTSSSPSTSSASRDLPDPRPDPVRARRRSSTRRGCSSRVDRALPGAHAARAERARRRRVAADGRRDGDQRHALPLRARRSPAAPSPGSAAPASASRSRRSGSDGLTGGAGWIAIALVIFAFWRAELCLVGAYFFGAFQALPFTLQARGVHDRARAVPGAART